MSVLDQLKNLTPWDITAVLGSFLATIAPGFLIIHLFNPELIIQLEVMKLFLFSAAITLPLIAINSFVLLIFGIQFGIWSKGIVTRQHLLLCQIIWAFLTLYFAIFIAYIFNCGIREFICVTALVDIVFGIVIWNLTRKLSTDT